MKEYTYEVEQSWEKQRRPVVVEHHHRQRHQHQHHHQQRQPGGDDAAMDADASSMSGMYKHFYSIVSFCVYLKLRNKRKVEERSVIRCI